MITGVKIYDGAVIAGDVPWMDQESMLATFPTDGKDFAESSEPKEIIFVEDELDQLPWELQLDDSKPVLPFINNIQNHQLFNRA